MREREREEAQMAIFFLPLSPLGLIYNPLSDPVNERTKNQFREQKIENRDKGEKVERRKNTTLVSVEHKSVVMNQNELTI